MQPFLKKKLKILKVHFYVCAKRIKSIINVVSFMVVLLPGLRFNVAMVPFGFGDMAIWRLELFTLEVSEQAAL